MIKLGKLLIENDDFDEVDEFDRLLNTELTNVGKALLYRGVLNYTDDSYVRKVPPAERMPKDTMGVIQDFIERIRVNDYGGKPISRVKNVFFVTPNYNTAEHYGRVHIVFIPKKYRAVYGIVDPTSEYFSHIAVYWLVFFNGLNSFREWYNKELREPGSKSDLLDERLEYIFKFAKEYDENDKVVSLDPLRELLEVVDSYISDHGSIINPLNSISSGVNQIVDTTEGYFADLVEAKAPWFTRVELDMSDQHSRFNEKKINEIVIQCEYYYLVDFIWFSNNFMFDEELNRYRKI